ncbi:hypothetical protein [Corynebacterium sp.]|uniref:hypothetical protein n=1 Tax=Corynebacterium sp. TaxID=1720 RepID=UPI0026DCFAEB|nr:hypothetical protein [Corynebacterium sp.]MDO5033076.1 hypothetical protein [Corynebacterium sp.]
MRPIIIDADTSRELWRAIDCANHCGISTSSWRTYNSAGRTPTQVADLCARMPLWDAEEVKAWHTNRPGSPVPGAPKPKHR